MQGLLPIIRRIRRPLLPVESKPVTAGHEKAQEAQESGTTAAVKPRQVKSEAQTGLRLEAQG